MTFTVLDPTALRTDDITEPGPALDGLRGKTIGFRVDIMWRSWDWVSDVWAAQLQTAGAKVVMWRTHQDRTGAAGEKLEAEMKQFLSSVDAAFVGLGNCGSCTGWTIHDALAAAAAGIPAAAVVTGNFEELGRNLARRGGRSGLRLHVLPYPLNERLEADVRQIALEHFPLALRTLGLHSRAAEAVSA